MLKKYFVANLKRTIINLSPKTDMTWKDVSIVDSPQINYDFDKGRKSRA